MADVNVGLIVRLEARPGREAEVESFLEGGLSLVEEEPDTTAWFAIRLGESEFGIFDAFPDGPGRRSADGERRELFEEPTIERLDVMRASPPGRHGGQKQAGTPLAFERCRAGYLQGCK